MFYECAAADLRSGYLLICGFWETEVDKEIKYKGSLQNKYVYTYIVYRAIEFSTIL